MTGSPVFQSWLNDCECWCVYSK